ncbi:MAG: hypothetical protein SFZ24_08470 [Planctomycetota bacterium]|nr:hypothetical protein [Planctomycetota bacterium]
MNRFLLILVGVLSATLVAGAKVALVRDPLLAGRLSAGLVPEWFEAGTTAAAAAVSATVSGPGRDEAGARILPVAERGPEPRMFLLHDAPMTLELVCVREEAGGVVTCVRRRVEVRGSASSADVGI